MLRTVRGQDALEPRESLERRPARGHPALAPNDGTCSGFDDKAKMRIAGAGAVAVSNLSRTLKTMSGYGLVELKQGQRRTVVPHVPYDQVRLDVSLESGLP